MRSKLVVGLILAIVAVMLIASGAMAQKLLCVSKKEFTMNRSHRRWIAASVTIWGHRLRVAVNRMRHLPVFWGRCPQPPGIFRFGPIA